MPNFEYPPPSIEAGGVTYAPPQPEAAVPLDSRRRPALERLRAALFCALLAAATGVAVQAILLLHAATEATPALPGVVSDELRLTRVSLLNQVAAARRDVLTRTERQVAALRVDVMGQVAQIRTTADRRVGDSLARVDTDMDKIEELRGDLKPILEKAQSVASHVDSITAHVDDVLPAFTDCAILDGNGVPVGGNPDCLFNRYQGATKAWELAMQRTAEAMLSVDATAKAVADKDTGVPAAVAWSVKASQNTNTVMANLAKASKPLPAWARIGLAVAPPLAQVGASVATTLAVAGSLK